MNNDVLLLSYKAIRGNSRAKQELKNRLARAVQNIKTEKQHRALIQQMNRNINAANTLVNMERAFAKYGSGLTRNEEGAVRSLFGMHYVRK